MRDQDNFMIEGEEMMSCCLTKETHQTAQRLSLDEERNCRVGGRRTEYSENYNVHNGHVGAFARLVKQGDTIRVDGASPWGSRQRGREGVREGVLRCATSTRPSRERERGRTQDQVAVRRSRRLDDCKRRREHHRRVPSLIKDHGQLRRAHDQSEYLVRRKMSQSEVDRMVQDAEKSRDEDEVDELKHEAESGVEKFRIVV